MNYLKYLTLILAASLITSCGNDWLDVEPSTSIQTESGVKSLKEVEFSLNGIYSTMQSADAYSGRLVYYADVTGDDMQAVSSTKRTANYYRFNFTKDNGPSSHWAYLYNVIQNCNVVLASLDRITANDAEKAYRNARPPWHGTL